MKKLLILAFLTMSAYVTFAQSCAPSCDKTSCGPEGTKKEEAAVITTMRSDLQTVITKMSNSSWAFDKQVKEMSIGKGASDDESLFYISQAATAVRFELLSKVEPTRVTASLKDFKPTASPTKQQMVANLKKEIQLLAVQADKL
jgi:hypothetical protein